MKILIAYIPVLHRGYFNWLDSHNDAEELYLIQPNLLPDLGFDYLMTKDIRMLGVGFIQGALATRWEFTTHCATPNSLAGLRDSLKNYPNHQVVLPDEDISQTLTEKYLQGCNVIFENVFLRYDKKRTFEPAAVIADRTISQSDPEANLMAGANWESSQSSDWWLRVGGVLVKDGQVLLTRHNVYLPSTTEVAALGDPRMHVEAGTQLELSLALHVEAGLIAEAARQGLSASGADLYLTHFPCPACARLVTAAGIKRFYFKEGYSSLDAQAILRDKGVEIIRVEN